VSYTETCNAVSVWHYAFILDTQDASHNGTASGLQVIKWQCAGMAFRPVHVWHSARVGSNGDPASI